MNSEKMNGCLVFEDAEKTCSHHCGVRGSLNGHKVCSIDKISISETDDMFDAEDLPGVIEIFRKEVIDLDLGGVIEDD